MSGRISFAGVVLAAFLAHAASAAAPAAPAAPHTMRAVRVWTDGDHTRVVIDMSARCPYTMRTLTGPARIVIDVPSCAVARGVKAQTVGDGVLDRIRVNRLKSGAQVVLDLAHAATYSHFPLKSGEGKPHRIVVDIERGGAPPQAAWDAPARGGAAEPGTSAGEAGPATTVRAEAPARGSERIVIIDPGHGGAAPGCVVS